MKRALAVILIATFFCVAAVCAQTPPQAPKPALELQRLNYFVGSWTTEADMKPGPFGPGGKYISKNHAEWMPGGFFLTSHNNMKTPMGPGTELAVMGYKPDDKVYTYDAYNSMGEADHSTGTLSGDTWTWTSDEKVGGKMIKGRFIIKELSPTAYSFKFDMQPEGGEWATLMEGKSTKIVGKEEPAGKEKKKGNKEGKEDKD